MALSDYGELQTEVAAYMRRRDLGDRVKTFIRLFEDRVCADLRVREMEERKTATVTDRYVPLPGDFLAMKNIQLGAGPEGTLTYVTQDWVDAEGVHLTGRPRFWSLVGNRIQLVPGPSEDEPAVIEMSYSAFERLTDDVTVNWLIQKWPSAYLFGAIAEGYGYMLDTERQSYWDARTTHVLDKIRAADRSARHGAGPLIPRGRANRRS